MKIVAEICVLKPKDTTTVVETLINNKCSVVIRGDAYDQYNPTIFVVGYGEADIDDKNNVLDHFESMLAKTGGDVAKCGEGPQDIMNEVVPLVGPQFAIDVCDDQRGITHRLSCAKYSPERAYQMMVDAWVLLGNVRPRSSGNALARRLLLEALERAADDARAMGSEADDELKELLKKEAAA